MESRRKILDATFEIASELGYEGTSIAKVSARSGLPASSVYWHFANKDELLAEVIQDSFDSWWQSVPHWDRPVDGSDRLELVSERIDSAIASIAANPEFWRLGLMLTLEHQEIEPTARQRFIEIRRLVTDNIAKFWRYALPGADSGDPGTTPAPELMARFTMAVADGLFITAQAEGSHDLDLLADMLAHSLEAAANRLRPA